MDEETKRESREKQKQKRREEQGQDEYSICAVIGCSHTLRKKARCEMYTVCEFHWKSYSTFECKHTEDGKPCQSYVIFDTCYDAWNCAKHQFC